MAKENRMNRSYYQQIRDEANADRDMVGNDDWRRAYEQLSIAADHVDAMIARCTADIATEEQEKAALVGQAV